MDAELPVFHICHPKPCWHKTHPILGCILCKHGFTCKIRNNGNSAPIFRSQSGILLCNRAPYHLLMCEHKKIDGKPISRSLKQCQNLTLILETPKTGAASIFLCSHTSICYGCLLHIIILDWQQNMVRKFHKLRSNHADMCVRQNKI